MIVIDMDMPKYCGGCFYEDCPSRVYEEGKRPKDCPIKCTIEDIKAEMKEKLNRSHYGMGGEEPTDEAYEDCLWIIEKHTI